jgi:hypothetical protein
MEHNVYEESQQGTAIVVIVLVVLAIEAFFAVFKPSPVVWVLTPICMVTALVFSSMTVAVSNDSVQWWLAFGLFRRRLQLSEIERVKSGRLPILAGLGIRTDGRNWLWLVSGRDVVTFTLRNGKCISLGSADATRLAQVINELIRARR